MYSYFIIKDIAKQAMVNDLPIHIIIQQIYTHTRSSTDLHN